MTVLTLRIDDELDAQLTRLAEATQRSKSDLVRSFIRRQIALATFERARSELVPLAEQTGWLTDEDVFRDLS